MNTDVSPVQKQRHLARNQDSALRQGFPGNEKCREDIFDSHKEREVLPRCSFRRNMNEHPSDAPIVPMVAEAFSVEADAPAPAPVPTFYNANTSRLLAYNPEGSQQRYQTFTVSTSGAPQAGPAIVQYAAQSGNRTPQYYVPASKVVVQGATGDMSAYQIRSPSSSLPQSVVMAGSPGSLHSPQQLAEEASRKRELRLMKNREAARECRRKKKEYVKCLENRVAVLENQNKMLIEELRTIKDLEAAKECRRRKREYIHSLETRLTMLELQNKKLVNELEYLKEIYAGKLS